MKPEGLTQRLLSGLPVILKEGDVTRDELGERSSHHSVVRIQGVANLSRERAGALLEQLLGGKTLEVIHSDSSTIVYRVGTDRNSCRMCLQILTGNTGATIATYDGPKTSDEGNSLTAEPRVLRIRETG